MTGIRRDQAPTRANAKKIEWDKKFGLVKCNPLADWTWENVWEYVREHNVPYNPLHEQNYPSIGCASVHAPGAAGRRSARGTLVGIREEGVRVARAGVRAEIRGWKFEVGNLKFQI